MPDGDVRRLQEILCASNASGARYASQNPGHGRIYGHGRRFGSGHVTVNHRAADQVTDVVGLRTRSTVNRPDGPVYTGGATPTLVASASSAMTFPATLARGNQPDQ